jgi:aspartyl-tRNA(Asn)/glutamyl-tRNA(Gln) amidotransferase subunit C
MEIKDVEKLAELARIELSEDEKKAILKDMGGILEYIKQIEEVEAPTTVGVPTGVGIGLKNIWREDVEEKCDFSPKLITEQFPDSQDGFLKVKKIL